MCNLDGGSCLLLPYERVEVGRQPGRDRAGNSLAHLPSINVDDGDHLRRRAGQEAFLRGIDVVPRERGLAAVNPCRVGKFHHRSPRDAFEDAGVGRRREQPSATHDEYVVARALGHFPLVVEHEGFDASRLQALQLRHDIVEIVE